MNIDIPGTAAGLHGYLAVPQGEGPWPGLVVLQDLTGANADIRRITDRFAAAGYLALAPNLYSRGGFVRCVGAVFAQLTKASGQAFDDIDAARTLLAARPDHSGKTGVVGFCMGGGFALVSAARGFDASAPYYGTPPRDPAAYDGACPVVASFGAKDPLLRGAAAKLERELTTRGVMHDIKEYPGVGHSFANELPAQPFLRVLGFGHDPDASEDAWSRVLTYFATHLSPAPQ